MNTTRQPVFCSELQIVVNSWSQRVLAYCAGGPMYVGEHILDVT
jgi:hypothetical protein